MLALIIITFIFLIFPIFLSTKGVLSLEQKKLSFSFYLFGVLKIFGGYGEVYGDGVGIHISKNKAIFIPYKSFLGIKNTVKPLQDYHFIRFKVLTEIGSKNSILPVITGVFLVDYVWHYIKKYILYKKPYLDISNQINVFEGENKFNVFIDTMLIFNLLMIVISIIKMTGEKIINGISKRKQNKSSN